MRFITAVLTNPQTRITTLPGRTPYQEDDRWYNKSVLLRSFERKHL